ncbi:hypothetical protein Tco_0956427 [Tanacetum coccineum]
MEAQDRASVEEQTISFMEAQDHMKKAFIQNGITRLQRLDFRPITSRLETWNEEVPVSETLFQAHGQPIRNLEREVLCKNVSLIDAVPKCPHIEERAILFMEAQDRVKKKPLFKMRNSSSEILFQAHDQSIRSLERGSPHIEERAILFMEAQDRVKKKPLFKMRNSSSEILFQAHDQSIRSLERGSPHIEERAILFMEAQDRVKKKPLFKMRNSSSEILFQAHDQSIRSLERGSIVLKCVTY